MPADLTAIDGGVRAAFNVKRGHPWHRLGVQVEKDMTVEEALVLSGSDDRVDYKPIEWVDVDGTGHPCKGWVGIVSNKYGVMHVATPAYTITQRRWMLELAYAICGLDPFGSHIDTIGNIGQHAEKFFAYIRVPDLVIDPHGIADTIERGLFVGTSFDGSMSNIIGFSNIRVVCSNTLQLARACGFEKPIIAKHTRFAEERMQLAAVAHEYVGAVEKATIEQAEAMLKVNGESALRTVCRHFWPIDPKLGEATKTRRKVAWGDVRRLYDGAGNVSASVAGENGWAAYQAVCEYWDHERGTTARGGRTATAEVRRAEAAVLPGTIVTNKQVAADLILSLN